MQGAGAAGSVWLLQGACGFCKKRSRLGKADSGLYWARVWHPVGAYVFLLEGLERRAAGAEAAVGEQELLAVSHKRQLLLSLA